MTFSTLSWQDLLQTHLWSAVEQQFHFSEQLGETGDWEHNLETGELKFDNGQTYSTQILGSLSFESDTWLWSWANQSLATDSEILADAKKLKHYGEQHQLPYLNQAQFEADYPTLYQIALVALKLCEADGYYFGDFGVGVVILLIHNAKLPPSINNPEQDAEIIRLTIQNIELPNHREAIKTFLQNKDYQIQATPTQLIANKATYQITASFDDHQRLTDLQLSSH